MSQTNILNRIVQKLFPKNYLISYAQNGEDLIIEFLLSSKKIEKITYLDIGANHPIKFNNKYRLYNK